jgi:AcrR family transcriptional regulator
MSGVREAAMEPLPRGRHGMSRGEVEGSQRTRLLRAMAEAMAEKGYARTSVADVLRRARVSRETFYELFSSKEDCFMSAFEEAYRHIVEAVAAGPGGGDRGGDPSDWFSVVLENYLTALSADPVTARVFLIEVYAAGPEAMERRQVLQGRLVDAIAAGFGATGREERFAVEAMVAAVVSLVTARLAVGDVDGLRALHEPLMGLAGRLALSG